MKTVAIIIATLATLGIAVSNVAAAGGYVGAGIGNTFFSTEVQDALDQVKEIDENSTAWKIFGGFSGPKFIGVEGGYRDLGTISSTVSSQVYESQTTGWDIEALGRLEIAIVDVFAKAGVMFWKTEGTLLGLAYDEHGTDFLWGLGGGVHLGPIGARVEWEVVNTDVPDNVSMVSLSATLGF